MAYIKGTKSLWILPFFLLCFSACSTISPGKKIDKLLKEANQEIEKETGLIYLGSGASTSSLVEEIEVLFASYRQTSIEEAMELHAQISKKIVKKLNDSSNFQSNPISESQIHPSISFYKTGKTPRDRGELALSFKKGNKIFSFTYDGTNKTYKSIFSETVSNQVAKESLSQAK